jgi:hypothetical protein
VNMTTAGSYEYEWERISTASSVADHIRCHVTGLRAMVVDSEIPWWIRDLDVPSGWLRGRYTGTDTERPWRISVCGPQSDGGWDACETLTVFGYTGYPPANVLFSHADYALRALDSIDVVNRILVAPTLNGSSAVRSSGYLTAGGLLIWVQCNYYAIGSEAPGQGQLIEQCLFAEVGHRPRFASAIDGLADAVLRSFVAVTNGQ